MLIVLIPEVPVGSRSTDVRSTRSMECQICCEKFNKSTHFKVNCNYCQFKNCRECFQKYLIDTTLDPHCMNCKKVFLHDFLAENCTATFINKTLKTHREHVLFDREKALMPMSQNDVVLTRERCEHEKNIRKLLDEKNELSRRLRKLNTDLVLARDDMYTIDRILSGQYSVNTEVKKFVRKCPMEDCRGFLSTQWKCGTCEVNICKNCNEVKDILHVECDPDKVKTMELINKDTKPCPKCGTMIHKLSGCFGKDTPILTWNGTIIMSQNIKIGDKLIGDDGNIRNVLDITHGIDTLYSVKQSDGIEYIVNSKHTLLLKPISNNVIHSLNNLFIVRWFNHKDLKYSSKTFKYTSENKDEIYQNAISFSKNLHTPEYLQIKVEDYIKLSDKIKSKLLGFKNKEGVHWEERNIHIDPYLLGLWLGDGNSNGAGFASNDDEIIKYFIDWADKNKMFIVHQDKYFFQINSYLNTRKPIGYEENCKACIKKECNLCSVMNEEELIVPTGRPLNLFRTLLSYYNLINNKHIPEDFLMNSRENRLKLLAGIIDTDGCVRYGKRITISQVNVILSKQIIVLAKSLGFIVHHRIVKKLNIPFPNTDKLSNCKDQYIINISGNIEEIPTILPRKKCVSSTPNKDYNKTSIIVSEIGLGEYYGFLLDNNHNFILEDFTTCQNCSQIWCVDCHTAWDWNRGTIETGVVHNPHYYEFLRKQNNGVIPRNPGDVPCGGGGLPYFGDISKRFLNPRVYNMETQIITNFYQLIAHIAHQEIRDLNRTITMNNSANRKLRVQYLMNVLTEKDFKAIIQQLEKKNNKSREYINIYQMLVDVSSDKFREIESGTGILTTEQLTEIIQYFDKLIEYFNENIANVGKRYKCVYPGIVTYKLYQNALKTNYRTIRN